MTLSEFETYSDIYPKRDKGVNAWIVVMRGCNNFIFRRTPHSCGACRKTARTGQLWDRLMHRRSDPDAAREEAGNYLLAKEVFGAMRDHLPRWVLNQRDDKPLLSEKECAATLAFTGYNEHEEQRSRT